MEQAQTEYREMDIQKVNEFNFLNEELRNLQASGAKTWLI